jgi:hypothetical protein
MGHDRTSYMGTMTLWDRIWPWLRHPLSMAASRITESYCNRHELEIRFRTHPCVCGEPDIPNIVHRATAPCYHL